VEHTCVRVPDMFQVRRAKERHQSARSGMLRRRERRGGRTWQQWRMLVMVRVAKVRRETDIRRRKVHGILKWSWRRWYMK